MLGAGTIWLLGRGDRGGVIAGVLALTAAVLTLAVQVADVPWQPAQLDHARLAAAALGLAREVTRREQAEQNLFLSDSAKGMPANVTYAPPEQVSWPGELVTWRSDRGRESGSLADIADFYSGCGNGRIVILGEPGAGKTVLANQLLLDLAGRLLADDPPVAAPVRVPVRMSLPAFDPGAGEGNAVSSIVAPRLDAWMTTYLGDVSG